MSLLREKKEKRKPGASSDLVGKIDYLHKILKNLPDTLPLDPPESTFHFGFDADDLEDGGHWMALNRNLESCFQRHLHANEDTLTIKYRSSNFGALIKMLKEAVKEENENYRSLIQDRWINRILDAARAAGGTKSPSEPSTRTSAVPERNVRARKASSPTSPVLIEDNDGDSDVELINAIPTSSKSIKVNAHQSKITFPKLTKAASIEQTKSEFEYSRKRTGWLKEYKQKEEAAKVARTRELARLRALKFRALKREGRKGKESGRSATLVLDASGLQVPETTLNVAAISREVSGSWKSKQNGKKGGTVQQAHKTTNYYHPFLWQIIQQFAPRYQYSAARTTKALLQEFPILFSRLNKGTMHRWLNHDMVPASWNEVTLKNVERHRTLAYKGRAGVLAQYPEIVDTAKTTFTGLRINGIPLSIILGRAVLICLIETKNPEIFEGNFKCSEWFVRNFFASILDMTPRRATRAAAHIPANADEICERTFFRLVNVIKVFDIPLSLVINMDQTGVLYIPGFKHTYETKGAMQVSIIGKDEKRGFTLCVSSTADGQFLPFQQVCSGKTMRSSPDAKADGMEMALSLGFHFTVAASEKNPTSHYSTLETMKQYMDKIFKPHYEQVLSDNPRLPRNQRTVLYLDAYPVHLSAGFLAFLEEKYPYVFPIFVPANCTGVFQPADVGLQRVIKHTIKQYFLEELVKSQRQQLAEGVSLESIKFTNSITVLRNASVQALINVFEYMTAFNGREIIKMAWRKCAVKKYNLSADMLTDPSIRLNDLDTYLETDKVLSDEIATRKKKQIIIGQDVEGEKCDDAYDEPNEDDSAVPLESVIASALKIKIPARCSRYCTHESSVKESDTGLALVPTAVEEDILAFNNDGQAWGEDNLPTTT